MSYQNNFASSEKLVHQVTVEELDAVRKVMLASSFELLEINYVEDRHVSETWKQSGTDKQVCLEIVGEAPSEKYETPATLQNVVDELVDLWVELRAIRNNTLHDYDQHEYFISPSKTLSSFDIFWNNVEEQRQKRCADPEGWSFLFKPFVDEYVCAYNELGPLDQKAITH